MKIQLILNSDDIELDNRSKQRTRRSNLHLLLFTNIESKYKNKIITKFQSEGMKKIQND
jgi:hypothetical protein